MATLQENFKLIKLTQKAVAASSDYFVHLGWRPAFVLFFNYTTGKWAVKFDDNNISKAMDADGTFDTDHSGTTGVIIEDYGVKLGQAADIKSDAAKLYLLCFRNINGLHHFTITGQTKKRVKGYGTGKQYGGFTDALAQESLSKI